MSKSVLLAIGFLSMAGCAVSGGTYPEPIPGSITYTGQPRTKLTKAPAGSSFEHRFVDNVGRQVWETYIIQPDRSLLLVRRRVAYDVFD